MTKAQINMIFTFLAALLVIGAIVIIAVKLLSGTMSDKCTADVVVFADKIVEAIRTNNDYGGVHQQAFLSPCDYKTICFVDATAITDGVTRAQFVSEAENFPGEVFIKDSVGAGTPVNIFLVDADGMVLPSGYSTQLAVTDIYNATCIPARQGRFTFIFKGQGRTTLVTPAIPTSTT